MIKKIYIESLGCSKNQVDSEKIAALLEDNNYEIVESPEDADWIIVNSCGFIESAKEEAINVVFEMAGYKKEGKCTKLVLAGCFAQRYAEIVAEGFSNDEVDLIFGIGDISEILNALNGTERVVIPEYKEDKIFKRKVKGFPGSVYLRISDGCSNNCSYCAIPLIRGELRSRPQEDILKELEILLSSNSVKEINIISQDTTNYGVDLNGSRQLFSLLKKIDDFINDEIWIRVLYMHPDHITEDFIDDLKTLKHFVPYFDIPFQSGSEKILKKMGRSGSIDKYLLLIDNIRKRFPDAVFRSTFITGFPAEKDTDHNLTMEFIEKAKLDWVGGFTYSDEEGTKAYDYSEKISARLSKKRLDSIMNLSESVSVSTLQRFLGKQMRFLVEESVDENLYLSRFWGQAPEVDGLTVIDTFEAAPGEFTDAVIKKLNGKDFFAAGC